MTMNIRDCVVGLRVRFHHEGVNKIGKVSEVE
jgi:hypothetical protein